MGANRSPGKLLPALSLAVALAGFGVGSAHGAAPAPTEAANVAEGVVRRYLSTPYCEPNGLRLADGRLVLFGPPMASAVFAAAPVGAHIRVIGNTMADGALHAVALVNLASGNTAAEAPPAAPAATPPARRALDRHEAAGTVDLVLHGPRGEANGVMLGDGSVVYFRPDLVRGAVAPGQPFAAIGIGSRCPPGLAIEAIVAAADLATARKAAATVFNPPSPPRLPTQEPARHVD